MTNVICEPKYIKQCLDALAETHGVKVIHACESGSRAWGFESPDSDYDVRFIYVQPLSSYLAVESFDKTITEMFPDRVLDFHGWDIHKALGLLVKGNATFVEWMLSPIVYQTDAIFAKEMAEVIPSTLDLGRCYAHYRSMAKSTYLEHVKDHSEVNVKKYFYVLRPLLAAHWINRYGTFPPVAFRSLIAQLLDETHGIRPIIEQLLAVKASLVEHGTVPADRLLTAYIEMMIKLQEAIDPFKVEVSAVKVNRLLKDTILRLDQ